ncbi:DUF805 domain-containing protein [Roseibacillus ishigakijimensis]|uniref:DUF805 domain-containing protein n=1 Tax=Roseibacillus ishigakijimensis TaxID=454146 RepID=A0A934RK26_9BACT|nr:DUF805 domain-containing protein [Roseibacillus ishigakijimensis]MBK1832874.1 DUF805 domain-containing protein [Roseibacillus ishigakijimensis]
MSDNLYQAPTAALQPETTEAPLSLKDKLFSGKGRFSRSQYWGYGVLGSFLVSLPAWFVYGMAFIPLFMGEQGAEPSDGQIVTLMVGMLVAFLLYIPAAWVSFAAMSKRFHDRGKSGWMALVCLIPWVGGIWILIECGCLVGTPGPNPYGSDPLQSNQPPLN